MAGDRSFLDVLWDNLRAPKVSDTELDRRLQEVRRQLPVPVFWLLGKAQSGKTSLVRAMTGGSREEIGNGFRPCTRFSRLYPLPDPQGCFLQFLDTRGLGEVDYDPADDVALFEQQSHCLMVVVKAMDHAQQCVLAPLRQIVGAHRDWPVIVVQTTLHEGYPASQMRHVQPYPFASEPWPWPCPCPCPRPWPPEVPHDLARSLSAQRELFAGLDARFVPVDFTLPEDGLAPEHYGLDALWDAIERALPLGLRSMLLQTPAARRPLRDAYFETAHPHILGYALAAGAAGGIPVPLVDIPLFIAIQAKLFHAIASIYGQPFSAQRMAEVFGTLGVGFFARLGGRELLKFVPAFGSAVSALFAAASTYALGCTLCAYFSRVLDGDVPDGDFLRQLYKEQYEEGRRRLSGYLGQHTQG